VRGLLLWDNKRGGNINSNPHKTRNRDSYVLSESNKGAVTNTSGLAQSALMVNGNDPQRAIQWLKGRGATTADDIFGDVIAKLEEMV